MDIYPEMGLLDHMVVPFLIFFRDLYAIFHNGCTNLHSHQECTRVPFSLLSLSLIFLTTAIQRDVRWYLIVVLGLLAICISSLGKGLFSSSAHLKNWIVWGFLLLHCRCSLYVLDINPLSGMWFAHIFSHLVDCLFVLLMVSKSWRWMGLFSKALSATRMVCPVNPWWLTAALQPPSSRYFFTLLE